MKYRIVYSDRASNDFRELYRVIAHDYGEPQTAFHYTQGLIDTINSLKTYPTAHAVRNNHSLLKFGFNVRRVNYKKIAIIYTIHDDVVFIRRIIAGSLISDK